MKNPDRIFRGYGCIDKIACECYNTVVELKRLNSECDEYFSSAMRLYETAFPEIERRDRSDCVAALGMPNFHADCVLDGDEFVGIAFYWESDGFIFLDHFAVAKHLRGSGYGSAVLLILKNKNKQIILEIEPPEADSTAAARKKFYERAGFVFNPNIDHVQLRFRKSDAPCRLKIMSYPAALSVQEYTRFRQYIESHVLHA